MTLSVEFTEDQYNRFKAALTKLQNATEPVNDACLIAQMKREASAITYAAEVGTMSGLGWSF